MAKVVVGMSGGVDSAVAAWLLKKAGYEVVGLTLKTWQAEGGKESRCCEITDAEKAAWKIGIPFYVKNCVREFMSSVCRPFMEDYLSGRTPNPCILCNPLIKWDGLLSFADQMHADYVATGHYASVVRMENGRFTVRKGADTSKDQTYMLCRLTQDQLQRTIMPLGNLTKEEVRRIAAAADLPVALKPDSQEICFVTQGTYADFIEEHYEGEIPGDGNFTDEHGQVLGRHKGIIHYTVGQRKGLGLSLGKPVFVKRIDADKNQVIVADKTSLFSGEILCGSPSFMGIGDLSEDEELSCLCKIRYHHKEQEAVVKKVSGGMLSVRFPGKVTAPAPGQAAAFYDKEGRILGSGIISQVL